MVKSVSAVQTEIALNREIGVRLRDARQMAGMRQIDVANKLGISPGTVNQMEIGSVIIKANVLVMMSQALDTPMQFFMEGLGESVMAEPVGWAPKKERADMLFMVSKTSHALASINEPWVLESICNMILGMAESHSHKKEKGRDENSNV